MDPIADMLVIIKNGYLAKKSQVNIPYSKFKFEIAKVLAVENPFTFSFARFSSASATVISHSFFWECSNKYSISETDERPAPMTSIFTTP